jgi:LPS O-antigen subunit length determinant protein (WzzB/FepE family)
MHPEKRPKSPLNRSDTWFLALSDGHPIENSKQNQHARYRTPCTQQAKNNGQSFALVSDTKKQSKPSKPTKQKSPKRAFSVSGFA